MTESRRHARRGTGGSAWGDLLEPARRWWGALQDRERRLLAGAALLVAAALVWMLGVQPAWQSLKSASARLDALDGQMLAMQRLALEAKELRGAPQVSAAQSVAALRAASARLGAAGKLTVQGDRAVLALEGLSTEDLRAWLAEVRSGARARAVEAQLSRGPKGFTGSITVAIGGGS